MPYKPKRIKRLLLRLRNGAIIGAISQGLSPSDVFFTGMVMGILMAQQEPELAQAVRLAIEQTQDQPEAVEQHIREVLHELAEAAAS